jgi:DNA mismatch repair protein MutL
VNKRFVRDKVIAAGLREGFRSILPHGFYPIAFLFLDVPIEEIDVNVHPAKTEIRFRRTEAVKEVIAEAVKECLSRAGVPNNGETRELRETDHKATLGSKVFAEDGAPIDDMRAQVGSMYGTDSDIEADRPSGSADKFPKDTPATLFGKVGESFSSEKLEGSRIVGNTDDVFHPRPDTNSSTLTYPDRLREPNPAYPELPPVASASGFIKEVSVDSISALKIRPIAQLHRSYIIAEDADGLLLIDQHVAHERILFDKFRRVESERPVESQMLLLPETIDLTPPQAEVFHVIEDQLLSLGFELMRLSGRTVAIKSVPNDVRADEAKNLFLELLDVATEGDRSGARSSLRDIVSASLACRAAIKINTLLSIEKMQWLVDRLLLTSSPTTCPHGRPVVLRLKITDIERGFQRS